MELPAKPFASLTVGQVLTILSGVMMIGGGVFFIVAGFREANWPVVMIGIGGIGGGGWFIWHIIAVRATVLSDEGVTQPTLLGPITIRWDEVVKADLHPTVYPGYILKVKSADKSLDLPLNGTRHPEFVKDQVRQRVNPRVIRRSTYLN